MVVELTAAAVVVAGFYIGAKIAFWLEWRSYRRKRGKELLSMWDKL
jgi:hypothetical protein